MVPAISPTVAKRSASFSACSASRRSVSSTPTKTTLVVLPSASNTGAAVTEMLRSRPCGSVRRRVNCTVRASLPGGGLAEPLVDGVALQGAVDHLVEGHADRLRLADAGDGRERLVHHGDAQLRIDQGDQGAARFDDRAQPGALLLELLLEIHALLDVADHAHENFRRLAGRLADAGVDRRPCQFGDDRDDGPAVLAIQAAQRHLGEEQPPSARRN